ncbi:MAG: SH3 domain-containing protein [Nitrospirota bacterium]
MRATARWRLFVGIACVGLVISPTAVFGKDPVFREAVIIEPFLEIHTGPGSSYPVFYVAEKGETIALLKRRVDWYEIRLRNGTEGWAHRREIEKTLLAAGYRKSWTERIFDEIVAGRTALGWSAGTFSGEPALYVRVTYTLIDSLALEANGGFVSGDLGGTQLYHGGMVVTPWRARWLALSGTIGGGVAHVSPTSLLVNVESGTFPAAYAGAGFAVPLFRNLEGRVDIRHFTLFMSTERTREFQEYSAGLSFRF